MKTLTIYLKTNSTPIVLKYDPSSLNDQQLARFFGVWGSNEDYIAVLHAADDVILNVNTRDIAAVVRS